MEEITLGIDTTGPSCSLALLRGREPIASIIDDAVGTAEQCLPRVLQLLRSATVELHEVARIAVCSGPGSFTGIRTGFASAQGLAFAKRLPVLGVSSLLCRLLPHFEGMPLATTSRFVPMIRAREGEYYRCALSVTRNERGDFRAALEGEVGVTPDQEVEQGAIPLDGLVGMSGAALAGASFDLCLALLSANVELAGLCQIRAGGLGLLPVYVKPVNAKTLEERHGVGGA